MIMMRSSRFFHNQCHRYNVHRCLWGSTLNEVSPALIVTKNNRWENNAGVLTTQLNVQRPRGFHHVAMSGERFQPTIMDHHQQPQQYNVIRKRTIFIQTENTPNPESIKFVPTNVVVLDNEDGTGYFISKSDPMEDILKSPLATELFKIDGVKAVYFGSDFVTVTKYAENKWQLMRPEIFSTLMDFFETPDFRVMLDAPLITDTTILDDDDEVVAMIKELIEDRIRPAVQEDGGDIRYKGFDETTGIVTVQLAGSCVGCPSSSVTLKQGVENMLIHYIPEVTAVVSLEDEPSSDDGVEDAVDGGKTVAVTETKSQKSYEERLRAAGIPFSD